jgi:putative spermidine/putrescine transport system permease protein
MVIGARPLDRLARFGFTAVVFATFAFITFPLLLIFWLSFVSNEILSMPPEGYSLRWYSALFNQPQFISGFGMSFIVATLATIAGLIVTLPACFAITRLEFRGREAIVQLLMSPLIVPAIVIGAAVYIGFVEVEVATGLPITGSALGMAAGHVLLTIPWSMRLITANLINVNRSIEEAALSLGAKPIVVATKVTLPMIWPGIVAAALFSFVISFSNVELSLFLVAPGQTTLPIAILQYLQWKIDPTIAAVSVLQILIVAAGILLTNRFVSLEKVV